MHIAHQKHCVLLITTFDACIYKTNIHTSLRLVTEATDEIEASSVSVHNTDSS